MPRRREGRDLPEIVKRLFEQARAQFPDPRAVNHTLLELSRFYDPVSGGVILEHAIRRRIVELLAQGQTEEPAFCAAAGRERTPTCTLLSGRLRCRRGVVGVFLSADSFLHHMVRNVVGSLVEIGRGNRPPEWMAELLLGRDRTRAGPTAPGHGLTLLRVSYPPEASGN